MNARQFGVVAIRVMAVYVVLYFAFFNSTLFMQGSLSFDGSLSGIDFGYLSGSIAKAFLWPALVGLVVWFLADPVAKLMTRSFGEEVLHASISGKQIFVAMVAVAAFYQLMVAAPGLISSSISYLIYPPESLPPGNGSQDIDVINASILTGIVESACRFLVGLLILLNLKRILRFVEKYVDF